MGSQSAIAVVVLLMVVGGEHGNALPVRRGLSLGWMKAESPSGGMHPSYAKAGKNWLLVVEVATCEICNSLFRIIVGYRSCYYSAIREETREICWLAPWHPKVSCCFIINVLAGRCQEKETAQTKQSLSSPCRRLCGRPVFHHLDTDRVHNKMLQLTETETPSQMHQLKTWRVGVLYSLVWI